MFLIVRGFGVSFEGFGEALGDCGGCSDVFRFWEESRGPDPITFLKLLFGGAFRVELGFVVLVLRIFDKGWEWASATGINPLGLRFLSFSFIPPFRPTTHATLG